MLTDGAQTRNGKKGPYTPLAEASQPLKDKGVDVWAIAVGKRANISELQVIASDPKKVFIVSSFKQLKSIIEELQKKACEGTVAQCLQDSRTSLTRIPKGLSVL